VASPIPGSKNISDKVMIETAEAGMKYILEGAVINKVERIVVTSSFSTIVGSHWKKTKEASYSEEDFAPLKGCDGYS
jgi:nucleoside-diphosphate-sugar epimerase